MKVLAPIFFSATTIMGLFFGIDLIADLDFKIFVTDSLVHIEASIKGETTKDNSSGRSNNPPSFRGGKGQLERPQELDHSNSMLSRGTYSHKHLDPLQILVSSLILQH